MQTKLATMLKLTAGALTLAVTMTACQSQPPVARMNAAIGSPAAAKPAAMLVAEADAARAAGNPIAAISFAELAVSADPHHVGARNALAKAYLAAGRYQSAADSYDDIAAMNAADNSTLFRAALAELASGDRHSALARLDGLLAAPDLTADIGLAFALAGETERAVDMLTRAVRGGDASPRVRQNLALAQALSGKWAAARMTASIDLSPDIIDARVAEWAALASNPDSAWRTARVLGVEASASDTGRPAQLAWAAPQVETAVAVAASVPLTGEAPVAAPVEVVAAPPLPVLRPDPVRIAKVELPPVAAPKPAKQAVVVKASIAPSSVLAPKAIVAVKRSIRALPKPSKGDWVVQLGSYAQPQFVLVGWQGLVHKNKALGDYKPMRSSAEVDGDTYHRLSVGRFTTAAEAGELCSHLKSRGNKCFVRKGEGAAPETGSKQV